MVVRTGVDPRELSELLTAVAERREGSFEHFYDATSSRVFGLVVRTLRDRRLTEDVVQEVYLQIWEQAPHFDPARGSALSWVLTLAHRRAVDHVRREQSARHRDEHYAAVDHTAVPDHATTVIVGANACGKSTLLRGMARLLRPTSGAVLLDAHAVATMATRQVARTLGLLPQNPIAPEGVTVVDLVSRGRHPHQGALRRLSREDEAVVAEALADQLVARPGASSLDPFLNLTSVS